MPEFISVAVEEFLKITSFVLLESQNPIISLKLDVEISQVWNLKIEHDVFENKSKKILSILIGLTLYYWASSIY